MNKKAWYWIGGVVIVVIIIIICVSAGKSSPASAPASSETTGSVTGSVSAPSQASASAVRQTMHDLITSGATQTCKFSIAATATSSGLSGTIYIASGNMQGDFIKTDTAGKVTNAHMIITSGIDYLWSDASLTKGYKLSWSVAANSTILSDRAGGVNINQPTAYSCSNWTADQSKFTIPANIQFTDITAMIKAYDAAKGR
jgi:hypothetical protein